MLSERSQVSQFLTFFYQSLNVQKIIDQMWSYTVKGQKWPTCERIFDI